MAQPAFDEALPEPLQDPDRDAFFWESQREDEFPDWLIAPMHYLLILATPIMRTVAGDVSETLPSPRG